MKVYLGRAVSGQLGPRSLQAIRLAHQALKDAGAETLCERVVDPNYGPGVDRPELVADTMRRELEAADAGCLEVTGKSTGVGFEAGWLLGRGRPVLLLYDADEPPTSAVVLHPPSPHGLSLPYRDLAEIAPEVEAFYRRFAEQLAHSG